MAADESYTVKKDIQGMEKINREEGKPGVNEVQGPALTDGQIAEIDSILRSWVKEGACLLVRNGDPSMGNVKWTVQADRIAKTLRRLANYAELVRLQDLAAGREEAGGVRCACGFLAAARAVERLALVSGLKEVSVCRSDPEEHLHATMNDVTNERYPIVADIERVAPGWHAKAEELAAALKNEPLAKPLTAGYLEVRAYMGSVGRTVLPEGSAERIASAKAGICVTERGDIRLNNVTHRLYEHLGRPHELLGNNYEGAAARIKSDLSLKWLSGLTDFIGGYEAKYGERLGDAEIRYLHELVNGDMTPERRKGYARVVGAERRDVRFRPEDFAGGEA